MKIIDQSYEIIDFNPEREINKIAAGYCQCYNRPIPPTYEEKCDYIKKWRKHGSPIEHGYMTVDFTTNLGVANEIVRHRHSAYSQESTRYCNYSLDTFENSLTFVMDSSVTHNPKLYDIWINGREADENEYLTRLSCGQRPEEARGCLPKDLATKLLVSANLREWHSILELRTSIRAHYQMRELMIPLLKDLQNQLSCLFDDIPIQ